MEPVVHDGPNAEGFLILQEAARDEPHLSRYLNLSEPRPRWTASIELERDPVQVGFASSVATIRKLEDRIGAALGSRLEDVTLARTEYAARDLGLLDVLSEDASKARGLSFLCERLGIPRAHTLAIGDNWNDLDMLEHAGIGVVMANAPEALRSRDFAIAGRNDEAGVAEALERLVLRPEAGKRGGGQKKGG